MTFCIIDHDTRQHYAEQERAEELQDAIDARKNEEMSPGGKFDPTDADNIAEAISEAPKEFYVAMGYLLVQKDHLQIGAGLEAYLNGYWGLLATDEAIKQLEAERKSAMEDAAADRAEARRCDYRV